MFDIRKSQFIIRSGGEDRRRVEAARESAIATDKAKHRAEIALLQAIAARERAERKAEKAKHKIEIARQQAISAQKNAEQEMENARHKTEIARQQAVIAQKDARSEEETTDRRIYQGNVRLNLIRPVSVNQIKKCEEFLTSLPNVQIVSSGGSAYEGPEIIISVKKPLALCEVISSNQLFSKVLNKGERVEIIMNVPQVQL